jgi:hypothetical protein
MKPCPPSKTINSSLFVLNESVLQVYDFLKFNGSDQDQPLRFSLCFPKINEKLTFLAMVILLPDEW